MASNRRKRKSPSDIYLNHLVRDPDFESRRRQFYQELQNFYRRKWNCPLKLPRISGSPLDLFELYRTVGGLGGWLKVSNANRWFDVLESMGLSTETGIGEHAIRVIYMRQLARFEQFQTFGEDADNEAASAAPTNRSGRGKHYLVSLLSSNECPFNRGTDISAHTRASLDLPAATARHTPYDRLVRSLQCGLPNEVDFAVNVCMLLSHPGPKFLRLARVPTVVDLLLAHAGIFDNGPGSYKDLYEGWSEMTKRKFVDFWEAAVTEEKALKMVQWCESDKWKRVGDITDTDTRLFSGLKPIFDPKDVVTSRIVQIASILRNLSFEAENKATLASSFALLKFLYVCVHCRWTPLQSMALDTLSNIAPEINLSNPEDSDRLELVFRILSRCLYSDDKFHIVRALEALSGLCHKDSNEAVLCEHLNSSILEKIMTLVAVKDIMMCVYTLECLYQISELGTVTCQRVAERSHAVEMLVSLATVEAVSFGPSGLMGMKVVEYGLPQPHTALMPHPSRAPHPSPAPQGTGGRPGPSGFAVPARPVPHPVQAPAPSPAPMGSQGAVQRPLVPQGPRQAPYSPAPALPPGQIPVEEGGGVRGPQVAVLQDEKLDQLTLTWIRGNVVAEKSGSVSRGELYAKYAEELRRLHGSLAVSANTFSTLLRQVFPSISIRREEGSGRGALMHVDGILYAPRTQRLPMTAPSGPPGLTQPFRCPSPGMRPPAPASPAASPSVAVAQHPIIQKALMAKSNAPPLPPKSPPVRLHSPVSTPATLTCPASAVPSGNGLVTTTARPPSGDSAQPIGLALKHPNLANKLMHSVRARPSSVGTPEESLSGPPSPESLVSGVGTESPGPNSPKSIRSVVMDITLPANCHLEVCEKAQEAKNVIELGENHEAKIIRIGTVENTRAVVGTGEPVKMNGEHSEEEKGGGKTKGRNNNEVLVMDETLTDESMKDIFAAAMKAAEVNGEKQHVNGITELKRDQVVAMMEAKLGESGKAKDKLPPPPIVVPAPLPTAQPPPLPPPIPQPTPNNHSGPQHLTASLGLNSTGSGPCSNLAEEFLKGRRRSTSPSPNFQSLSENLNACQKNIQELLEAGEKEKNLQKEGRGKMETDLEMELGNVTGPVKVSPTPGMEVNGDTGSPLVGTSSPVIPGIVEGEGVPEGSGKKKIGRPKKGQEKPPKPKVPRKPRQPKSPKDPKEPKGKGKKKRQSVDSTSSGGPDPKVPPSPSPGLHQRWAPTPHNLRYMCEWNGCGRTFLKASAVYYHAATGHITDTTIQCKWPHCDKTIRLKWSMTTHVQDVHCNEMALKSAALRRYEISVTGQSNIPEPRSPPPHPGYSHQASIEAIRRHAFNNIPKDLTEENEGPVTKSIRLTSCLILRNLARYSAEGRRILKHHESHLAWLALSQLESASALSQCLAELNSPPSSPLQKNETEEGAESRADQKMDSSSS